MTPSAVSLPDTQVHRLHADAVGDDFEIWIATPQPGFVPSPVTPRVLYLLDANLFFGTAVEMTRVMHKLYGELPPLLVVGIAYPTDDGFRQGMLRTRDFTPSQDQGFAEMAASFPAPEPREPVTPAMGGAEAFLRFLLDQVDPFVRERFDVADDGATLFGSSMGGLFTTYALLNEPDAFDNYLAVSPALWWNDGELMRVEPQDPTSGTNPRVFFAAGGLEEAPHVPMLARFRLISNARDMAGRLVELGWPEGQVTFEEIPGETHTSVVPVALTRGLRAVYRSGR